MGVLRCVSVLVCVFLVYQAEGRRSKWYWINLLMFMRGNRIWPASETRSETETWAESSCVHCSWCLFVRNNKCSAENNLCLKNRLWRRSYEVWNRLLIFDICLWVRTDLTSAVSTQSPMSLIKAGDVQRDQISAHPHKGNCSYHPQKNTYY